MTQPVRLLVSDVDGTLVDKQKRLSPATVAAVARLKTAGVGFTIISARPRSGLLPLIDALAIDAPVAGFNGGLIFRQDGRVDARHLLPREVAHGMLALAASAPVQLWVFAGDQWYASTGDGYRAERERVAANQEPVVRADFADLADRADKITLVSDDAPLLADLLARARAAWGDCATVGQSQPYFLDVTAREANKGDGVAALAAAIGVPLAETGAIGDQQNDLAMLECVGLPIAMGNAPDAVKAAARHVTNSNEAGGVAGAIDRLLLSELEHA